MQPQPDPQPDPQTWKWLVQLAAEHHGGSVPAAIIAIVQAARAAEQGPEDPWAQLEVLARTRSWPAYRVPVGYIVEFIDSYDPARDGDAADDVLQALTRALTRPPTE